MPCGELLRSTRKGQSHESTGEARRAGRRIAEATRGERARLLGGDGHLECKGTVGRRDGGTEGKDAEKGGKEVQRERGGRKS